MNIRTPRGVALACALLVTLLGLGFTFFVLWIYDVEAPLQAVALGSLGLFFISMAVIYSAIERFIYQKVRIIYKNIHRFKSSKERAKDVHMGEDVMEKVRHDVVDWATEKVQEISHLKEQDTYRKEFMGNLAHELKTPVFNIQGYILTLLEGALEDPEHNRAFLMKAAKNVDRMAGLIDDLDVITKIEGGSLDLNVSTFELGHVIHEVMDQMEQKAKRFGVHLDFVNDGQRKIEVVGDASKIEQVLTNLISNSLRYGIKGGKTQIRCFDMEEHVLVEVADDGIGMSEEHLPRIFERFYRVDKSRSRNAGGSGLGLAIVKHIIEAHEQSISVRSTLGTGSTFAFTLAKS